jgi:ubiquinone/menaquinone biosynthesis C-methylase UbiE
MFVLLLGRRDLANTKAFDENVDKYEKWFVDNEFAFQSELRAIISALPNNKCGVEIGIGSGVFANNLGIKDGIEPSLNMRNLAKQKGLNVLDGIAEALPYSDATKDFALMITTVCFVDDVLKSFREVNRILKKKGQFIIAFVDKNSMLGKTYLKYKNKSVFYVEANFFGTEDIYNLLRKTEFKIIKTYQTIFGQLDKIKQIQNVLEGHGKGSFVVIKSEKV